jgi:hypothetical protein
MLVKLLIAWALMGLCVVVHAGGITYVMRLLRRHPIPPPVFWPWTWIFIRIAGWIVVMHLIEVVVWAAAYTGVGAMPDVQTAFYFSIVTYTTTGYGDLVLPEPWRVLGGIEALTGILMCGWSTGFFFAVLSRMYEARDDRT